jgi:hypothetical protein
MASYQHTPGATCSISLLLVPFGVMISDAQDGTPVYLLSVDIMEFSDLSSAHNHYDSVQHLIDNWREEMFNLIVFDNFFDDNV